MDWCSHYAVSVVSIVTETRDYGNSSQWGDIKGVVRSKELAKTQFIPKLLRFLGLASVSHKPYNSLVKFTSVTCIANLLYR